MKRPCYCENQKICRLCWLYHNNQRYHDLWNEVGDHKPYRNPECIHLGRVIDRRNHTCQHCFVRQCDVHGQCVTGDLEAEVQCCRTCEQYNDGETMNKCDQAHQQMSVAEMIALIKSAPPGPWPTRKNWDENAQVWRDDPEKTWHCWENTQAAMRQLVNHFIENDLSSFRGFQWQGKGIVIAGGMKPVPSRGLPNGYLPSVWVTVKKLRQMGCRLPIELWYLGFEEMDPYTKCLLKGYNVDCIDGREVEKKYPCRILCGWELKPYAAFYSKFAEVLFLDADCAPVNQPVERLFEQAEYLEHGSCFWPDYGHWDLNEGIWRIFDIEPKTEAAFESGQFLINKKKCWRELRLALFYAEYSDYTFGHVYGDKEVFHLAWRKLGTPYAMPAKRPLWEGDCCIVQHNCKGERVLLHRCQDKWQLNGNRFVNGLEDEKLHHDFVKELKSIWTGKHWSNPNSVEEEMWLIDDLTGKKFRYQRLPQEGFAGDERFIRFGEHGYITEGAGGLEQRWDINLVSGDYKISISSQDKVTCILTIEKEGLWSGRWLDHEKCLVRLQDMNDKSITKSPKKITETDIRRVADFARQLGYDIGVHQEEITEKYLQELLNEISTNRQGSRQSGQSLETGGDFSGTSTRRHDWRRDLAVPSAGKVSDVCRLY